MKAQEVENKIRLAGFKANSYAQAYINALYESEALYGEKGVKTQILYIFSNLKASGDTQKQVKAELLKYAKSR